MVSFRGTYWLSVLKKSLKKKEMEIEKEIVEVLQQATDQRKKAGK